ncbi:MAG: hypothetical protein UU03_C0020G0004 [Candidatus Woesebacteria bacterium GW2011_GWA1_40_45]|uniref:Uncharacterized protein n=1 Tax=Candidatus Woesebacteria bacterium GW2011_GWA1_40_45 TaxID=1618554 RepID=A0A0G0SKJ7_9BACT|nr:MAG: hypothetical protein UU03_C0020G0004 [Candidatus Woesebacteria bacterium GW2011_GWA1_40_45]
MYNRRYANNRLFQKFVGLVLVFFTYLVLPAKAYAVCPVCTIAVGAGLGLSRYLGIDDSITGVWAGGLMVSVSLWTVNWLKGKNFKFLRKLKERDVTLISFAFWVSITYPPLFWAGIIGHPFNTILGIDKLVFGSIIGVVAFLLGVFADEKVRKIKGRQLFQFQKVLFPVISLIIFSLVLYFYGGYLYKIQ